MDLEERRLLRASLSAWGARNAAWLSSMEKPGSDLDVEGWSRLFDALEGLGVLHVLFDEAARGGFDTVAEAANCLSARSPSLALLVVQQNLAARVLGESGAGRPTGWVALPLYDGASEWRHQVQVEKRGVRYVVNGRWGSIPGLSMASSVLLPLAAADGADFALARVDFAASHAGILRGAAARSLGLRGCPVADLSCADASFSGSAILAAGPDARRSVESLWSQAEALMTAIRAGIVGESYSVARDYAAGRWQGKKLIVEHSVVQRMLAELYGVGRAIDECWREMSAGVVSGEALSAGQISASLHFGAAVTRLASDGIQLLGGYGYLEELGQERRFRDAKQCEMLLGHPQARSFSNWRREAR